jgi:hypothetical protein
MKKRRSRPLTAKEMARKRWEGVTKEERAVIMREAGRKAWSGMSPEERSAELKRRAKVRKKKN